MEFEAALEEIRTLWNNGAVFILPHARLRMQERGIDELDLQHIIQTGRVVEEQLVRGNSRFKVAGRVVEGNAGACVVEIEGSLLVVTVMTVESKR